MLVVCSVNASVGPEHLQEQVAVTPGEMYKFWICFSVCHKLIRVSFTINFIKPDERTLMSRKNEKSSLVELKRALDF